MGTRTWLRAAAAIGVSLSMVGCGSLKTVQPKVTPASAPPVVIVQAPAPPPVQDPITTLIVQSQQHFMNGERERSLGHLEQAKKEFDSAIDVLLKSPYGARTEPRIRQHFDLLVERIRLEVIQASNPEPRTDFERAAIRSFLQNKPRGIPRVDDRRVLKGIFWVLRSGARRGCQAASAYPR